MTPKDLICAALFRKILFIGKQKNHLVNKDDSIEALDTIPSGRARVVVLGKKHYFEATRTFPITNMKEIRAAIEMDMAAFSPLKSERFLLKKTGQTSDNTKVNMWFLDERSLENLRELRPLLIIPETALLSLLAPGVGRIYTVRREQEILLAYVGPDGAVKSVTSSGQAINLESFRRMVGFEARDCPVEDIADTESYLGIFRNILTAVPLKSMLSFLNLDLSRRNFDKRLVKIGVAAVCVLFLTYTALACLLPYRFERRLRQEDKELSQSLSEPLAKQAKMESFFKRQRELAHRINSYTYKISLLQLLDELVPDGVKVTQLTVSGNMVELRGTAPKASELLSALSRGKGISNAQFSSPIKDDKKSGMEKFTLSLVYQPGAQAASSQPPMTTKK